MRDAARITRRWTVSTAAIALLTLRGPPPTRISPVDAAFALLPPGFSQTGRARSFAPMLDRSRALTFAEATTRRDGLTGRGVVVGVLDSGIDLTHADLRRADGSTRVAWLLDFTVAPVGLHPALEARFAHAENGALRGAVWSADDLDPRVRAGAPPSDDSDGHGTFVASIAASNGLATTPARYVGLAPESTLVVVRGARDGVIDDDVALKGAAFVFDRADAMGAPAVLNLSLGSHDGAHDGDSSLERALGALAPPDRAGRAIVCAAGNDGDRPVHARLALSLGAEAGVPFYSPQRPADGRPRVLGLTAVWREGLSLSVRLPGGSQTPWVAPTEAHAFRVNGALVSIANSTDGPSPRSGAHTAAVLVASGGSSGAARAEGVWELRLRGSGRVDVYLARDDADGFSRARLLGGDVRAEGTVALPATSADVIAVGALRTREGFEDVTPDVASFSALGPALDGALRPDLVAPGDAIVAARAHTPRNDPGSLFADRSRVSPDGEHVAASGTSAAAPHVSGAVALLFQLDPTLTSREIKAVLTAAARPVRATPRWSPFEAHGALDVLGAVDAARALRAAPNATPVDLHASELSAAEDRIAPGERTRVSVRLVTRDGRPVREHHRVALVPSLGTPSPAEDTGLGRYEIPWRADGIDRPATVALSVSVDGAPLGTLHVEVSPGRPVVASGGCAVEPSEAPRGSWWMFVGVMAAARRARARRPAPPPEGQGRTPRRRGPRARPSRG